MGKIKPKKIFMCQTEGSGSLKEQKLMIGNDPLIVKSKTPDGQSNNEPLSLQCHEFAEANDWEEANDKLLVWADDLTTQPVKTKIAIAFDNGFGYQGEYPLVKLEKRRPKLNEHVRDKVIQAIDDDKMPQSQKQYFEDLFNDGDFKE